MENTQDPFVEAKEVESNWFKFLKVGDHVRGTLIAKHFQKGTVPFPDQYIYELKQDDGEIINVGISVNKKGTVQRLNRCKIGEIIGIMFKEEIPPKTAGFAKTKVYKVFTWGMDKNFEFDHDVDGTELEAEEIPFTK